VAFTWAVPAADGAVKRPFPSTVPTSADHSTSALAVPFTFAENRSWPPTLTEALFGEMLTLVVEPDVSTVTVAVAVAVESASLVAVTVTVPASPGAVKCPSESICPEDADHVTLVSDVPVTVAVKASVASVSTVAVSGDTLTATCAGVGCPASGRVLPEPPEPPQPTTRRMALQRRTRAKGFPSISGNWGRTGV
jgi:hypothetical protein